MPHTIHAKGGGKFWSNDKSDAHVTKFELKCYPGTGEENNLKIEVFDMVGEVDEHGNRKGYNPLYGYTIVSDRPKCGGCAGYGYESRAAAEVMAFSRAAAYGNGGFPLDSVFSLHYKKS